MSIFSQETLRFGMLAVPTGEVCATCVRVPAPILLSSGSPSATITVTADGTGLSPGIYTAAVVVNSTTIPVTFTVFPAPEPEPGDPRWFSLSAERLEMTFAQGAASAVQTVQLDGTAGLGRRHCRCGCR